MERSRSKRVAIFNNAYTRKEGQREMRHYCWHKFFFFTEDMLFEQVIVKCLYIADVFPTTNERASHPLFYIYVSQTKRRKVDSDSFIYTYRAKSRDRGYCLVDFCCSLALRAYIEALFT